MKPQAREDWRYSKGAENKIDIAEETMFLKLPNANEKKLLDVGCGTGTISLELQRRGFEVYGIDFSSVGIQRAREKGINAIECDLDKDGIPFENSFFDVVWAGDVVEHVFDPLFLLKEINRVLKYDGKILLSTPNDINIFKRISVFLYGESPQSVIYRDLKICKHHTVVSLELLEYMLKEAGLSCDNIGAIIKTPKIGRKRYSRNRILCSLFSDTFIVETRKV